MKMKLIICEKPNVAGKVRSALGPDSDVSIVSARGHLLSFRYPKNVTILDPAELNLEPIENSKEVLDNIVGSAKNADTIISATDLDREGSAIFLEILWWLKKTYGKDYDPELKRMNLSSLTPNEIKDAWNNLEDFDWGRSLAGVTRNIQDLEWGLNMSYSLTGSARSMIPNYTVLSSGRVQTPMLKLIYDRDVKIEAFDSEKYYNLIITCVRADGQTFEMKTAKKIDDKKKANDIAKDISGKEIEIKVSQREHTVHPPKPMNGTDLQVEGNRAFGISPKEIADRSNGIAQRLYQAGLISYPGTDSQKYPADWGKKDYDDFYGLISTDFNIDRVNDKPVEGDADDPAHPCLRPVASAGGLQGKDKKIYDLILRRCLAGFCKPAKDKNTSLTSTADDIIFNAIGTVEIEPGFRKVYPYNSRDDKELPDIINGEKVTIQSAKVEQKKTNPPPHYNTTSMIKQCSRMGIGTKNTRPAIMEKLGERGYVTITKSGSKQVFKITPLGRKVIETMDNYAPIATSEKLTKKFNSLMDQIEKAGTEQEYERLNAELLEELGKVINDFEQNRSEIGTFITGIEDSKPITCPDCGKEMRLKKSKSGKLFYGCMGYPDCTFSLFINNDEQVRHGIQCECGLPLVSGKLKDFQRGDIEYVRCIANCKKSPLKCKKCKKSLRVYVSKKGDQYTKCCDVFNHIRLYI